MTTNRKEYSREYRKNNLEKLREQVRLFMRKRREKEETLLKEYARRRELRLIRKRRCVSCESVLKDTDGIRCDYCVTNINHHDSTRHIGESLLRGDTANTLQQADRGIQDTRTGRRLDQHGTLA